MFERESGNSRAYEKVSLFCSVGPLSGSRVLVDCSIRPNVSSLAFGDC